MASRSREYILDELLCFLSNPIFQVPVLTFMEDRCIVFDPEIEDCQEYRKTHEEYKNLVDTMMLSFEKDTGLDYKSIMNAVQEMNDKEDIRIIFQTVLEQVMSSVNFQLYVRVMTHKNITLQEEALQMIMKNLGALPDSLTRGTARKSRGDEKSRSDEDAVFAAAMEKSKKDFDKQNKRDHLEEEELQAILEVSRSEARRLSDSRKIAEDKIDSALNLNSRKSNGGKQAVDNSLPAVHSGGFQPTTAKLPPTSESRKSTSKPKTSPPTSALPQAPLVQQTLSSQKVSGADAAASWLKSAENESGSARQNSDRHREMQSSMESMTMDEKQQRLAFLRTQRDKLVKMKKEEREKQLRRVESSQPQRPQSALAARRAMSEKPEPIKNDPEADKRLAMRKAIAERLKLEVIDRH